LAQRKLGFEEISYGVGDFNRVIVDDNFWALGETIGAIPEQVGFVGLESIWYFAVRPIPRIIWENKPIDPGFDLAHHLGQEGVSFSITSIGEMYMSFGWIAIVI